MSIVIIYICHNIPVYTSMMTKFNPFEKGVTKQQGIIKLIEEAIETGQYQKDDVLPSANKLSEEFGMSRLTVLSAYRELQSRGTISSFPGKGYFVTSERTGLQQKIFVLFDELNSFKEDLYNSFLQSMGKDVFVDIYFHHFNIDHFKHLIVESIGNYTSYVIMPVGFQGITETLARIPQNRLYILDQNNPELPEDLPIVYQNFEKDTYTGLVMALDRLKKYDLLVLSHYEHFRKPAGIMKGFVKFCEDHHFPYEIDSSIRERKIKKGEAYFLTEDRNLVHIVLEAQREKLVPGSDIGIIAYNETEFRKVISDGITTISTDFSFMGQNLSQLIKEQKRERIENPSALILRNSL